MKDHKLDTAVEDILQHYGVKGMKWGKTKKKITNSTDKLKTKSSEVSNSVKKKGQALITKVFGEGKPTYSIAKPDKKLSKNLGEAMKKASLSDKDRSAIEKAKREEKERAKKAMSSNKKTDAILDKYKKQGYKKHEKNKKTLAERGYTFRTKSGK